MGRAHRIGRFGLTGIAIAVFVILSCAPAFARFGSTVSAPASLEGLKTTVRPNALTVSGTIGGTPTRLTFEGSTVGSEPVSGLSIEFPEGTDLSGARVDVVTLEGLKRVPVEVRHTVEGSRELRLSFSPPVNPDSTLRVQVHAVSFPIAGGDFMLTGRILSPSGASVSIPPASSPVEIHQQSVTEKAILWLDAQAWVAAWNKVTFLSMFLKPQLVVASFKMLFVGWLRSILLVAIGFPLAIPVGLLLAFAKMAKLPPVRWIAAFYINAIRGTPLFLQIYIAFFGLPLIGIRGNEYVLGMIVLALNSSAYLAEIFRAGIQSIHKGQFEAAASLGMRYSQAMQFVIIPQTVKRVLPTMTSEFILLYKDTAMLAAVGVFELMMYSKNLTANTGNVTPYVAAAVYYLLVTTPLINWVQKLEKHLAVSEGGHSISEPKKRTARDRLLNSSVPAPEAEGVAAGVSGQHMHD